MLAVSLLEGDLAEVEALRDVKVELLTKKEVSYHRNENREIKLSFPFMDSGFRKEYHM